MAAPRYRSAFDRRAHPLLEDRHHLTGFCMPPERGLGEHEVAVEDHLEASLRARDEVDLLDDRRPSREDLVRQTDGSRYVVSGDAELDRQSVSRVEHELDHSCADRRRRVVLRRPATMRSLSSRA